MKRPVPARAPHARARSVQHTDENKASRATSDTHARDAFATEGLARVARVMRRNERDIHVTDHGKRAELRRAETEEEVELLAVVGFVSVGRRSRDRASIHPCLPDAARVGGRSRALDNEKLMFSFSFKIKIKNSRKNFELETKSLKPNSKKKKKNTERSRSDPEPC